MYFLERLHSAFIFRGIKQVDLFHATSYTRPDERIETQTGTNEQQLFVAKSLEPISCRCLKRLNKSNVGSICLKQRHVRSGLSIPTCIFQKIVGQELCH